jgi:hypothetical protein
MQPITCVQTLAEQMAPPQQSAKGVQDPPVPPQVGTRQTPFWQGWSQQLAVAEHAPSRGTQSRSAWQIPLMQSVPLQHGWVPSQTAPVVPQWLPQILLVQAAPEQQEWVPSHMAPSCMQLGTGLRQTPFVH